MDDDYRTVEMVEGGAVRTVTYRQAVSLVSRGLAVWSTQTTAAPDEAPGDPDGQSQPQDDQGSATGDPSSAEMAPEQVGVLKPKKAKKSSVSAPARKGQEGVEAENKPPTSE